MLLTRKHLLFQSNSFCSKVFAGRLAEVIWGALYSLRAPLSAFQDFAASLRNHCRASRSERTGPSGEA